MATILGSKAQQSYKILVYVKADSILAEVTLSPDFKLNVRSHPQSPYFLLLKSCEQMQGSYASFHDNARQSWSLEFKSDAEAQRFAVAVDDCLRSFGHLEIADLVIGEGEVRF